MATNYDTEVGQISNSGMGIGERNSALENDFDNFTMPDERRPFSFVNRPRPSMYPLPIPEE